MLIRDLILHITNYMIFRFMLKRMKMSVGVRILKLATFPHKKRLLLRRPRLKKTTSRFRSCLGTFLEMSDIPEGNTRLLPMEFGVFVFEYSETIGMEDFDQVLQHTQLVLGVINTYTRYIRSNLSN